MKRSFHVLLVMILSGALLCSGCGKIAGLYDQAKEKLNEINGGSTVADYDDTDTVYLIPKNIRKQFTLKLFPADKCMNENGEIVAGSYITLGASDIEKAEAQLGETLKNETAKEGTSQYSAELYYYSENPAHIRIYSCQDADSGKEIIYCIETDSTIGADRGPILDEVDLIERYPDDLYSVSPEIFKEDESTELDKSEFDSAYCYLPDSNAAYDITFYFKNNIFQYAELYYDCNGTARWVDKTPVREVADSTSRFAIESAVKYKASLMLPCSYDVNADGLENDFWECSFDLDIPKLGEEVPNTELINKALETETYLDDIKRLKKADYPTKFESHSFVNYSYKLYHYDNLVALVTKQSFGLQGGGGGTEYAVFYFDNTTGEQISAEDYAARIGISDDRIIRKHTSEHGSIEISNIYDAEFYADENGVLQVNLGSE